MKTIEIVPKKKYSPSIALVKPCESKNGIQRVTDKLARIIITIKKKQVKIDGQTNSAGNCTFCLSLDSFFLSLFRRGSAITGITSQLYVSMQASGGYNYIEVRKEGGRDVS